MPDSNKLQWLNELEEEELAKLLDRDLKLVFEYCKMSTLIDLLENLPSIQLYISKRSIDRAQQLYIIRHFDGGNHKELAAKLSCSLKYVYQTLKEMKERKEKSENEPDLFAAINEK